MAIFPRKNPLPVQTPLLNEVASRTLDWSRAVRVENMEKAYIKLNNDVYVENTGKYAGYGNRFKLLVHGAIYTHQRVVSGTDLAIIVCNNAGDRIYTAAGQHAGASIFTGFTTPIIKANSLVVATKTSTGSGADFTNFYMVFVPTLSSVGITGLSNFLVYVDKFSPLEKLANRYPVPSDLLL